MGPVNDTSDVTVIRPTLAYVLDSTLLPMFVCAAPIALLFPGGSSRHLVLMAMVLVLPFICVLTGLRLLKIKVAVTDRYVTFHDPERTVRFEISQILGYEIERFKSETFITIKQEFGESEKVCINGIDVKRLLREINRREE